MESFEVGPLWVPQVCELVIVIYGGTPDTKMRERTLTMCLLAAANVFKP